MTSLRKLLIDHTPLLLIDAAATRVQAGLFGQDGSIRWQHSDEEAGVGIFSSVDALGFDLGAVRAFAFCEGPGSILGIRTTAMALRTWRALALRPAFVYCSLAVVAHALGQRDLTVIADARRARWHQYTLEKGLRRTVAAELSGKLVMPEGFRHWSPVPAHVAHVPYVLSDLLNRTADTDLFRETGDPDAFLHEEPSYATWTPQIHRAPVTTP